MDLNNFSRASSIDLEGSEGLTNAGLIDMTKGFTYFATAYYLVNPGLVTKVAFSNQGFIKGTKAVLSEKASTKSISFYVHKSGGNLRLAIYDASKKLIWQSQSIQNNGGIAVGTDQGGFINVLIKQGNPPNLVLVPGTYWLAYQVDNSQDIPSFTQGSQGDGFYLSHDFELSLNRF